MLTRPKTAAAAARLFSIRAEIAALEAEADTLTAALRVSLAHHGDTATGTGQTAYLAAASERKGWDSKRLAILADTMPEVAACQTLTPVAPSVRKRDTRPTDK